MTSQNPEHICQDDCVLLRSGSIMCPNQGNHAVHLQNRALRNILLCANLAQGTKLQIPQGYCMSC